MDDQPVRDGLAKLVPLGSFLGDNKRAVQPHTSVDKANFSIQCPSAVCYCMTLLFDSFWRAVLYCFRPRVMFLSMAPLLVMLLLALVFYSLYWDVTLNWVRSVLTASVLMNFVSGWLTSLGMGRLVSVVAPLLVILAVSPVVVVVSLLLVALLMTPALTELVADRRFAALERKNGGSVLQSLGWALTSTVLALVALLLSLPLWLVPPLILILPPLIWGWLTCRVMAFDALATHASPEERREIFRRHRLALLSIGMVGGYLGAAPGLLWASGVMTVMAVFLVPIAIWIYTLVFALSSLWFAHFSLAALQALRSEQTVTNQYLMAPASDLQPFPLHHDTTS